VSVDVPAFTTIPPQIHHKNTITITAFSQKPPAKTPLHHVEKKYIEILSVIDLPLIGPAAYIAVN
jgi:hypothetical protein